MEYFEVKDGDVGAFKAAANRFEFESARGYPGTGCSMEGVVGVNDEWCMAIE